MSGHRSVPANNHLADFTGEFVRVITDKSHYRGECARIDRNSNNVLLKNVVKKNDTGWIDISEYMLIMGHSVEAVYIEKSFPFDSNESLILSIEEGSVLSESAKGFKNLPRIEELKLPEAENE